MLYTFQGFILNLSLRHLHLEFLFWLPNWCENQVVKWFSKKYNIPLKFNFIGVQLLHKVLSVSALQQTAGRLQSLGSQRLRYYSVIKKQPYISVLNFRLPSTSGHHSALNRVSSAVHRYQYCLCVSCNLTIPSTVTHFVLGIHIFLCYVWGVPLYLCCSDKIIDTSFLGSICVKM